MVHFQLLCFPLLLPFFLRVVCVLRSPVLPWRRGVHLILITRIYPLNTDIPAESLSRPQCTSKSTSHTHPLPYTLAISILLWRHTGPWRTPTSPSVRQLSAGLSPWPARAGRFWSPGQHHKEPSNSPFYSRTPQIYFGRSSTYC